MNIILKENVDGLGVIGEQVSVKAGYARNFLVPKGLAIIANMSSVKEFEHQKRQLARKLEKATKDAEAIKARIEKVVFAFSQRASEEGKLFGSVTSMDIEAKLTAAGIEIDRKKIQIEDAIKTLGEHQVSIRLDAGVVAKIKVTVAPLEEA